ncbi:MAG: 2-C-methyl-D-erythritol 4-phosphate cytidylyltransferase [Pasteurellaceae bacterium]|nr:2-C-methyl-D-erythritol 4-phosphate cytidylyltransferase [Pasteurellaceae bacterium]
MKRTIIAVVPAAGVGSRMQADKPKQYLQLHGKTILEHSLQCLLDYSLIQRIILAVSAQDPYIAQLSLDSRVQVVTGGATRAESVLNGLRHIHESDAWALVHDAARPCLRHADLDKLVQIQSDHGGILAIPATDTIKRANPQLHILHTEDRSQLWLAQTPQFFRATLLQYAIENGLTQQANITDEASAMELAGFSPQLVAGRSDNIKITRPEDLALAEFYLNKK